MTFPVHLHLGSVEIQLHFIMELLAYSISYRYYVYLRRHVQDLISDMDRLWIFIGAATGGFLGGHLVGIVENPDQLGSLNWFYFMGNKTIVGGLLGGLIGVELTKKIIGVTTSSGDLMAFPLMLGMMIGRIGCFAEGLEDGTYGVASALPWAINFGDDIRRHPVQLYDIVFLGILWLSIRQLEKRVVLANGARFKIFLASYLMYRFWVERIKPVYFFDFGFSVMQLVCLSGILYYWKVFLLPKHLITTIAPNPRPATA